MKILGSNRMVGRPQGSCEFGKSDFMIRPGCGDQRSKPRRFWKHVGIVEGPRVAPPLDGILFPKRETLRPGEAWTGRKRTIRSKAPHRLKLGHKLTSPKLLNLGNSWSTKYRFRRSKAIEFPRLAVLNCLVPYSTLTQVLRIRLRSASAAAD